MVGPLVGKLVFKVSAEVGDAINNLRKTKETVKEVEDQTSQSSDKMSLGFGKMKYAIAAVGAAIGIFGKNSIGASKDVEQYMVSLQTLYKSQEAAGEQLQWILDFAKTTPFEVSGLVESTIKLKAFGLEAQDVLGTLGDTAAATSKPIDQVVNAFGRLSVGDTGQAVMMFRDLGVNLKNISGLQWDAQGSLVTPAKEALPIVQAYLDENFGGLMEAQSKTAAGLGSNIKDAFYQAGLSIMGFDSATATFRDGSLFNSFKGGLQTVLNVLNKINFTKIGQEIEAAFSRLKTVGAEFKEGLGSVDTTFFTEGLKNIASMSMFVYNTAIKYDVFKHFGESIGFIINALSSFYTYMHEKVVGGINLAISAYNKMVPLLNAVGADLEKISEISMDSSGGLGEYLNKADEAAKATKESIEGVGAALEETSTAATENSEKIPAWAGKRKNENIASTVYRGEDYFSRKNGIRGKSIADTMIGAKNVSELMAIGGETAGSRTGAAGAGAVDGGGGAKGGKSPVEIKLDKLIEQAIQFKEALLKEPRRVDANFKVTIKNQSGISSLGKQLAEATERGMSGSSYGSKA